jgi:hypothetical protein
MKIKILILLSALVFSGQSFAADENGRYAATGLGTSSCGKYLEEMGGEDSMSQLFYISYTAGYVTGVNFGLGDTWNITASTDSAGIDAFLLRFCTENPLKYYTTALEALMAELYPNRKKSAPK